MEWNAFDLINPAIEKTKSLLFPINAKYWFRLGFVSLFTGSNSGGSFRIPNFGGLSSRNKEIELSSIKSNLGLTGLLIGFFGIFALLLNFISSVFNFIFIDALVKKKYSIKQSWEELKSLGFSFFLFRILFGLILILLITIPILLFFLKFGQSENIFTALGPLIILLLIPLFLILILLIGIFLSFVHHFSLVDMYKNKIRITRAIKNTFRNINLQKKESLVFILATMVLGIAINILSLIVLFLILLILIPIGILFYFIFLSNLILGIILSIPILIFLIYFINVALLPLYSFMRYFSILSYEKIYNQKVLNT